MSEITDIAAYMTELGRQARIASRRLASATTAEKNIALIAIADDLAAQRSTLMEENRKDLEAGAAKGLDAALLDRLGDLAQRRRKSITSLEALRQERNEASQAMAQIAGMSIEMARQYKGLKDSIEILKTMRDPKKRQYRRRTPYESVPVSVPASEIGKNITS
jgi:hypothetical protein